jgi:two-component system cell cycle response regulator
MAAPSKQRVAVRWLLAATAALLAVFAVHAAVPFGGRGLASFLTDGVYNAALILATALTLARGIASRQERLPWLLIGTGMALWTAGDLYFSVALADAKSVPVPSLADAFYLAFYPFAYAGLVLLARARVDRFHGPLWLDGLIAALAVAAISAAVVVHPVVHSVSGASTAEVITNLAYPLADLVLLAMVAGALALTGWTPDRTWALIALGLIAFGASDSVYLVQSANNVYTEGTLVDLGWPVAMLLIACAAWRPVSGKRHVVLEGWRVMLAPVLFGLACLGLLVWGASRRLDLLALVFAAAAILTIIARMALTFSDNQRMLASSREEANTDPLTGLRNRRALMTDLTAVLAPENEPVPVALALLDLNGFKAYNDMFGHPAGDVLLARMGRALGATLAQRGAAYRMGGDEFCFLLRSRAAPVDAVVAAAKAALSEHGEGFSVSSAIGVARLPDEASTPSGALRLADRRMYADKQSSRSSERSQASDVLMRALAERNRALGDHLHGVAELAEGVGVRLGLEEDALDDLRRAAELHDVGKMAIPDAILDKRGPLDETEWGFLRRHTIIGERILAAAPALADVAHIVRASHERFDGTGYPDRVAGEAIPLGARIIFVCDAFDAMISERPYNRAMTVGEALAELQRGAGVQFDPVVVEAFRSVLAARSELPAPVAASY